MTLEQAQALWRDARITALTNDDVLHEIGNAARQFRLRILVRDVSELLATALLAGIFAYIALQPGVPRAAFLVAAVMAAFPMFFLGVHRWVKRESEMPSATIREHIQRARREVQNQQWLLERIQWWYLLPLAVSVAAFLVGAFVAIPGGSLIGKVAGLVLAATACAIVGIFIWRLNLRVAHEMLKPRADYLGQLADSLRENGDG